MARCWIDEVSARAEGKTDAIPFGLRDLDKLLSHYTDETVVVVPGAPAARTAETRRALLKSMIEDPNLKLNSQECSRVEVANSGEMGFAQCTYNMTMTDPISKKPVIDKGVLVEVYKKQADGSWKRQLLKSSGGAPTVLVPLERPLPRLHQN